MPPLSYPPIDPHDSKYKHKAWTVVEKALDERDAQLMGIAGYDVDEPEPRGPTGNEPCRNTLAPFPWETTISTFDKPASCTLANWKHTCIAAKIGKSCVTLTMKKGDGNNSLDPAMLDALQDAVMDLQERSDIRLVVLRAEGKLFSNGFDPKYLMSEASKSDDEVISFQKQFAKILYFWQNLPQYTVGLVQGSAMGSGMGLLAVCDSIIAVKGAFFVMSEVKLGAAPSVSIPYITPRFFNHRDAVQVVLMGASISAEVAKDQGFCTEVAEDVAGLDKELTSLCERLTLCAPRAVGVTKKIVTKTFGQPPSSFMLNYVAGELAEARKGGEAKAGVEAILTKKKPAWAEAAIAA